MTRKLFNSVIKSGGLLQSDLKGVMRACKR